MSETGLPVDGETNERNDTHEPHGGERAEAGHQPDGRESAEDTTAEAPGHGSEGGDDEADDDFDDALERSSGIIADAADALLRDAGAPLDLEREYAEEALERSLEDGDGEDEEDAEEGAEEGQEENEEEGEADAAGDAEAAGESGEGAGEGAADGRRRRRRRGRGRGGREERTETAPAAKPAAAPAPRRTGHALMLVNDRPGEECRVAILENGRIEALFLEREGAGTNVGNIYKARVTNIEPAIQAAFVDFGEGASGFLHISDLHPRYFPGGDKTEKVGKKIPRRERPLMQQALRKGQEVLVQVLKEGLGSKGPTLTSYLSIPGRLMVMMPEMGKVGVSRKVEDEEQRRAMRKILDQLDLPEGFGFILRTAGFDRTLGELNRDVAYLKRLWDVMQRRMETTGAPCLLYSEGDLLIRTLRDLADESVGTVVIDSPEAFRKAEAFLEVVAPTSAPKLRFWDRKTPLFHAFGAERQVAMLHSREVPLPSGGALVIDQTEAMVTIDVNSGRSRSARDSETNAYQTNVEAVEEIARQLRLRDLGGVIMNDLIDMRSMRHRREIEGRFEAALRRDRAKTTIAPISDFGVLEMTRQRMRPSVRKAHFMDCPHCHGIGEVKQPDSVAADALREIEWLFSCDAVRRVELVCSVRAATVLLSARRAALTRLERISGKRVDVRISEAIAIDRVDLYAYDAHDADLEIARLPKPQRPDPANLPADVPAERELASEADEGDFEEVVEEGGRRRRRRRRRKAEPADTTAMILAGGFDDLPEVDAGDRTTVAEAIEREKASARAEAAAKRDAERPAAKRDGDRPAADAAPGEGGSRRRRRRRGRGRGRGEGGEAPEGMPATTPKAASVEPSPPPPPSDPILLHLLAKELELSSKDLLGRIAEDGSFEAKSHMTKLTGEQADLVRAWFRPPEPEPELEPESESSVEGGDEGGDEGGEGGGGRRKRRRRRRGRGRGRGDGGEGGEGGESEGSAPAPESADTDSEPSAPESGESGSDGGEGSDAGGRRRRRRRRGRGRGGEGSGGGSGGDGGNRGGGGGGGGNRAGGAGNGRASAPKPAPPAPATPPAPAAPKPRSLYGGRVRRLAPGEKPRGGGDE